LGRLALFKREKKKKKKERDLKNRASRGGRNQRGVRKRGGEEAKKTAISFRKKKDQASPVGRHHKDRPR